jgi:hypothetical protein
MQTVSGEQSVFLAGERKNQKECSSAAKPGQQLLFREAVGRENKIPRRRNAVSRGAIGGQKYRLTDAAFGGRSLPVHAFRLACVSVHRKDDFFQFLQN